MEKLNYRMIELARNSRKISQKELSTLLPKLNQPNISKVERGELPISEEVLSSIASALDYPISFFYQEETKSPLPNIYFRKRATLPKKEFDKIFSDVKIILKSIDYLCQDIELKEYPKYSFDISNGWTPESAAIRMREIMQIHPGRPVKDIVKHIEELGIIVFFYDCQNLKFDGLTAYTDGGIPVIFVNKNFPNERLKFTIVHEMFHLVLHIPCDIEPWRDCESEANNATSVFFMPKNDCYKDLTNLSYNKLGELKSYWGVSKAAIIRRAKDLSLIDTSTYTYLMIELGRRGERKSEAGYIEIDTPKILSVIMTLLKNELGYTSEDLAKKICLSLIDYSLFFEPQKNEQIKLRVVSRTA